VSALKPLVPVLVEWDDCQKGASGWDSRARYRAQVLVPITSAGLLLEEDATKVILVMSASLSGAVAGWLISPRAVVRNIRRLK